MRVYLEPTARNLLRKPLVFGVPLPALASLALLAVGISAVSGTHPWGNLASIAFGVVGYAALRMITRFSKAGWIEAPIFWMERRLRVKKPNGRLELAPSIEPVLSPDTLDESGLIAAKESLRERVVGLKSDSELHFALRLDARGGRLFELKPEGRFDLKSLDLSNQLPEEILDPRFHVFSLYQLPVWTDPLWIFSILSRLRGSATAFVRLRGLNPVEIKHRVEVARRSNSATGAPHSDIDSDISFEEASQVLRGLSRGDECVVEVSWVLCVSRDADLPQIDTSLFCREKDPALPLASVVGIRKRLHRSHFVRAATACDLIPNVSDPVEAGPSILSTPRGKPLYFSPNDSRLEALHWLVVGASGSGKSFFAGLVLKRMIQDGVPMSVIFVDHNRSFRRLVRSFGSHFAEPQSLKELERSTVAIFDHLDAPGKMIGIELSDLSQAEKKAGASLILERIETFLRFRGSVHPIYVVLDECWNFMRDEPVLVQRAFREFRKLNGAAVAITQSLSDFLTDESGQSIFQNAPIRVLLRQGEDLGRYQGILGLNSVELQKARSLRQQKGLFSECLIKTPFLSRFGRLYPTEDEHALLRTDNLREELIAEVRGKRPSERIMACEA